MIRRDEKIKASDDPKEVIAAVLALALALALISGCTYFEKPGMNEWDYKMYQEGWQLEYIDDNRDGLRWINGTSINGTNSSNN